MMCSGRLDPAFVFKALASGADGVLITGCHPGECHYLEQNYKALRRYMLLRRVLSQMGFDPRRVKLVWASAAEGVKLAQEITDMVEEVRALGPLPRDHTALASINGSHSEALELEEEPS